MSTSFSAPRPMQLVMTATIVEEPREGVSPQTGKRWANITVGGYLGAEFLRISIALPDAIPALRFRVGEEWELPLSYPQSSKDRRVFLRLRSDPDGLHLLRRVDDADVDSDARR